VSTRGAVGAGRLHQLKSALLDLNDHAKVALLKALLEMHFYHRNPALELRGQRAVAPRMLGFSIFRARSPSWYAIARQADAAVANSLSVRSSAMRVRSRRWARPSIQCARVLETGQPSCSAVPAVTPSPLRRCTSAARAALKIVSRITRYGTSRWPMERRISTLVSCPIVPGE
jgi:hypothetical protein